MGGFFNSILQWNEWYFPNLLIGASGAGDFSCKWSRYNCNLCDIVTKASVAFAVSTDPDVHFKCCISADSKVQASIKHETKGNPFKPVVFIQVHFELTSQQSTGKCSLLLFFKLGHIALTFLVVIWLVLVQDSVVIKKVKEGLRLSSSPSVPSICGRMYRRKLSERRLRLICDRHYLLL